MGTSAGTSRTTLHSEKGPALRRGDRGSFELPENGRPDAVLRWRIGAVSLGGPPVLRYQLEPLEIGRWPTNVEAFGDFPGLDADVKSAALAAFDELRRQGATIENVDAPTLDLAGATWVTFLSEVYGFHRETLRDRVQDYSDGPRTRVWMGAFVTAADFLRAQRLRARLRREVLALLDRVEALVFPGQSVPAQRFENLPTNRVIVPGSRYTNVWNLLGLPAVVVPCGFSREGLPVSIQIVGHPFNEATVLRIARAYERATDWHTRRPDPAKWTL